MRHRFREVYKKIVLSYIVVVLISVLTVSIISYCYVAHMMREEMLKNGVESINRIEETLARRVFSRVENIWIQCAMKDPLIGKGIDNISPLSQYDYYRICGELHEIAGNNSDLGMSIGVYFSNADCFVSSEGGGKIKLKAKESNVMPEKLAEVARHGKVSEEWFVSGKSDGNIKDTLTFYRTVPYLDESEIPFRGYIEISIDLEAIESILKIELGDCIDFFIISEDGENIFATGNTQINPNIAGGVIKSDNGDYFMHSGNVVNYARIPSERLYLIRTVSDKVFFKRLRSMNLTLWLICVLFALLGLFVSILYAKQIYKPINRIVNNIINLIDIEDIKSADEYKFIDNTINFLSGKVSDLENEVIKIREKTEIKNVAALLGGEKYNKNEIPFRYEAFCAAAVIVSETGDALTEIIRRVLKVLEKGSNDIDVYYAVDLNNNIGIIANFNGSDNIKLINYIENVVLKENPDAVITVAIGPMCTEEEISASYKDAASSLKYKFLTKDRILLSNNVLYRELSDVSFSDTLPKQLVCEIRNGNEESIMHIVDGMINEIIESNCSYEQCRSRIGFIFSAYLGYVLEENKNPDYAITENTYKELSRCQTVFEFGEWFKNEIKLLLMKKTDNIQLENGDMVGIAVEIINANLDKELSLNFVADKLYIAPAYLSRIFKNGTGETFNAYITERRLELARKLVIETNLPVNVIADKCGFNSSNYLIRRFKDKYGQTPVNYKKDYIMKTL